MAQCQDPIHLNIDNELLAGTDTPYSPTLGDNDQHYNDLDREGPAIFLCIEGQE